MIPAEFIMGGGGSILLGVVGYFLRKTHEKIDKTATAIEALSEQIRKDSKTSRDEIIQTFQDICHERQGACSKLQKSELNTIAHKTQSNCNAITRLQEDREKRWEKQENINDNIKRVLYSTKDGGRSWQLKNGD